MPRSDTCQPEVITALEKHGWTILKTQESIRKGDLIVYFDIEAKDPQQAYIEVKCFGSSEPRDQFYRSLDQYIVCTASSPSSVQATHSISPFQKTSTPIFLRNTSATYAKTMLNFC